jgi:hypothetical protein
MTDPRYKKLAKLLTGYSCELKKGDRLICPALQPILQTP